MKKILLVSMTGAMLFVVLSSSSTGPSGTPPAHNTAISGCGGAASCHGSGSSNTTINIYFVDKTTGDTVKDNKYSPGAVYTVTITGTNSGKSAWGYIACFRDGSSMQAGTLANPSSGSKIQPVGGFNVAENNSRISGSGMFSATFDWTAPAKGTGTVTVNMAVNAVDGDMTTAGDEYNTSLRNLQEGFPVSVSNIASNVTYTVFPNPANDYILIGTDHKVTYQLYNMSGQIVKQGNANPDEKVNVSDLPTANYVIQIQGYNYTSQKVLMIQ